MKSVHVSFCILLMVSDVLVADSISYRMSGSLFETGQWPENYETRETLQDVLLSSTVPAAYRRPKVFPQSGDAKPVRFEVTNSGGYEYLLFLNEQDSKFPVYGRGSYIFKRDKDGKYIQVKIFLGLDSGCFLRLYPDRDRTRMDVFLYEERLYGSVMIPLGFDRIMTVPFAEIVRLTEKTVDWELVAPVPERVSNARVQAMIASVRRLLPKLRDVDDGAMDANGSFVFIGNGRLQGGSGGFNCSGFAKWVGDGVLAGREGKYFTVAELKQVFPEYRGNRWSEPREERDPYFGLDWSRNIAVGLQQAEWGKRGTPASPEAADVRAVPFVRYVEDIGYPVKSLSLVMYYQAVKDPGNFYLASVNREFGKNPTLRQHTHVAVLFPYFTPDGRFAVTVFERNVETKYERFLSSNSGYDLHLVKIRAPEVFQPPKIE